MLPAEASAQGHRVVHGGVVVGAPFYYPYYRPYFAYPYPFYAGFYSPFFWGWQYPPPPYAYYGVYDMTGAARLQVQPKQTQVFIDGYLVGKVDDFDGTMQRLRVEAGEHELELYLDGYKTQREKVLFRREGTITIKSTMQPLAPGETSERPTPIQPPAGQAMMQPGSPGATEPYGGPPPRMPPPGRERPNPSDTFGTLSIRVQPGDAEVTIDGQRWDSSDQGSRLSVQLAEGEHRVEVRKEGFRPYSTTVRISRGQTESVNISLNQ